MGLFKAHLGPNITVAPPENAQRNEQSENEVVIDGGYNLKTLDFW